MAVDAKDGGDGGEAGRNAVKSSALPSRSNLHLSRKLFHSLMGYGLALTFATVRRELFLGCMWSLAGFIFTMDVVRLSSPAVNRIFKIIARPFLRAHETSRFSGTPYYLFGVAVVTTMYPPSVAILAIVCLATLDPVAAATGYFSKSIPQAKLSNGKSVIGFIAAAIVCAIVLHFLIRDWPVDSTAVAVNVGILAAATELFIPSPQITLPFPFFPLGVDDNAMIPIVSAYVLTKQLEQQQLSLNDLPELNFMQLQSLSGFFR